MFSRYIKKLGKLSKDQIRSKLAILYAVISWNGFAIVLYMIVKRDREESQLPAGLYKAVKDTHIDRARIISFEGLNLLEDKTYNKEELQEVREEYANKYIPGSNDDSNDF